MNVLCSGAPLELNGKWVGSVFIARDQTELALAEGALRVLQELLHCLPKVQVLMLILRLHLEAQEF